MAEPQLKTLILLSHFLRCPGYVQSGNIFMSSLWVIQGQEVGIYTGIVKDMQSSRCTNQFARENLPRGMESYTKPENQAVSLI